MSKVDSAGRWSSKYLKNGFKGPVETPSCISVSQVISKWYGRMETQTLTRTLTQTWTPTRTFNGNRLKRTRGWTVYSAWGFGMLKNVGSISVRFSELFSWTGTACICTLKLHFKPVVLVNHLGLCLIWQCCFTETCTIGKWSASSCIASIALFLKSFI